MDRRAFLGALGLLAAPRAVEAEPVAKIARVGLLDGGPSYPERQALWSGFKQALSETGYVALPELAADLVRAHADVVVAAGTPAALAAKRANGSPSSSPTWSGSRST